MAGMKGLNGQDSPCGGISPERLADARREPPAWQHAHFQLFYRTVWIGLLQRQRSDLIIRSQCRQQNPGDLHDTRSDDDDEQTRENE